MEGELLQPGVSWIPSMFQAYTTELKNREGSTKFSTRPFQIMPVGQVLPSFKSLDKYYQVGWVDNMPFWLNIQPVNPIDVIGTSLYPHSYSEETKKKDTPIFKFKDEGLKQWETSTRESLNICQ